MGGLEFRVLWVWGGVRALELLPPTSFVNPKKAGAMLPAHGV